MHTNLILWFINPLYSYSSTFSDMTLSFIKLEFSLILAMYMVGFAKAHPNYIAVSAHAVFM